MGQNVDILVCFLKYLFFQQEEHKNQGAWSYVQPRFQTAIGGYNRRIYYVGRDVGFASSCSYDYLRA